MSDRIARIALNRDTTRPPTPGRLQRGDGITRQLVTELEQCVACADLDPEVHVIVLSGNGKGFGGGTASSRAKGLQGTQMLGTVFDGTTRHTSEGYALQRAAAGFRQAVRELDEPFGDAGASTFRD